MKKQSNFFSMMMTCLLLLGMSNSTQAQNHSCFKKGKVIGAILKKYNKLGACSGFLKKPKTKELTTPDGIGRYNHFEHGSIYWSPKTGAHEVHGAIRSKWASMGWEKSYLGYPTSDELRGSNGKRYSKFQGGIIYWTQKKGTWVVKTPSRSQCKGINTAAVIVAINKALYNTQIRLDAKSSISFTGTYTYKFDIPREKVDKPGYDWFYSVSDINSDKILLTKSGNVLKLKVQFEGNGNEIRGKRVNGPGNRDRSVPDINWVKDRSVDIYLKPIAYNNSIALEVTKVNVNGRFEINGRVDDICRRVGNKVENRIKSEIQKGARAALINNAGVKRSIANAIRPHLKNLGVPAFSRLSMNGDKINFCK